MNLANELMIKAIQDITVTEGFNPRECTLVAGGGAAGLGAMAIAGELGCERVILPRTAAVLSACGMQVSDVVHEHSASMVTRSVGFDFEGVNAMLASIDAELERFAATLGGRGLEIMRIERFVEARYLFQVWELDVALPIGRFENEHDVAALVERFHATHEQVFAVRDPDSILECLNWEGAALRRPRRSAPAAHERGRRGGAGAGQLPARLFRWRFRESRPRSTSAVT